MQSFEPPKQLIATEFREIMEEGSSEPLLVAGYTEDWSESHEIVLKLRDPDVPARGHGGTALACELLVAMWARLLGFEVPDYAIVEVGDRFPSSVEDSELQLRLEKNIGPNFGTVYLPGCRTWQAEQSTLGSLQRVFVDLMEFDSAILNRDRTVAKSNLLWDGSHCYPIDHSLALRVYRRSEEEYEQLVEDAPLLNDEELRAHICHELLRWKNVDPGRLSQEWRDLAVDEILDEVRDVLPLEWESESGDYDRIFDFLSRRRDHFEAIVQQLERLLS